MISTVQQDKNVRNKAKPGVILSAVPFVQHECHRYLVQWDADVQLLWLTTREVTFSQRKDDTKL